MINTLDKNTVVKMESTRKVPSVREIRRRVYCLGLVCMVMSLGQLIIYMVMLSFSISEEYHDTQVAVGSGLMAVLTATYLGFTARVLFLLYERRYEEAKGPEWIWWFASLGVILFNIVLVIWFALLSDPMPATSSAVAALLYALFFKFATSDIKQISENDSKARKRKDKSSNNDSAPGQRRPQENGTQSQLQV